MLKGTLTSLSFAIFTYTCTPLPLKKNFHFRMAFHKSLNTICDLNNYLVCKMPKGTLEVEVKVKTTWGKFTLVQNTHTRTERYCTWEKAQRCHIKSRKGRIPHKAASVHTEENFWNRHPHRPSIWESTTNLYRPHLYCSCDPHRLRRRGKTWNKLLRQILWILQQMRRNTLLVFHFRLGRRTWCK